MQEESLTKAGARKKKEISFAPHAAMLKPKTALRWIGVGGIIMRPAAGENAGRKALPAVYTPQPQLLNCAFVINQFP